MSSNPVKPVRWAVVGLGFFGEVHAETLSGMTGIELAAVCTRRTERLNEIVDRFGVPSGHTDYREVLADDSIDAISITTHIHDHRDLAIAALKAGKHVLLEKPMAPTVEDCDRILEAAEQGDGMFMVGHICRFDPRVALAKQAVDAGDVGRIVSMHARRNLSQRIGSQVLDKISALMGDGIHDADLMLWFSQARPVSVYAQEVHPGPWKYADGGWAMIRLDNDAIAVIESVWHLPMNSPYQIDARMEVIGTDGALYVDCGNAGLEIHGSDPLRLPDTVYWPHVFGQRLGALRQELRYFADCIQTGVPPTRITARESRDVVRLMAAAEASSQSGKVVELAVELE